MMADSAIQIEELSLSFGAVRALDEIERGPGRRLRFRLADHVQRDRVEFDFELLLDPVWEGERIEVTDGGFLFRAARFDDLFCHEVGLKPLGATVSNCEKLYQFGEMGATKAVFLRVRGCMLQSK